MQCDRVFSELRFQIPFADNSVAKVISRKSGETSSILLLLSHPIPWRTEFCDTRNVGYSALLCSKFISSSFLSSHQTPFIFFNHGAYGFSPSSP